MTNREFKNVLAVDTIGSSLAVSLCVKRQIYQRLTLSRKHANHLTPIIRQLCESASITLKDVDYLAVNVGPGPFTGLRVGIAYVKGLAHALSLPVYPIGHGELLAHHAFRYAIDHGIPCRQIATLIDARLGQVYFSTYSIHNEHLEQNTLDCVLDYHQLPDLTDTHDCVVAGNDWQSLRDQLPTLPSSVTQIPALALDDAQDFDARPIARIKGQIAVSRATYMLLMIDAYSQTDELCSVDAKTLSPLYVRNDVARKSVDRK